MFNSIRGRLSGKRADSICVETGGVEWELSVPVRSIDDFGALDDEVRAFTWLHHYEDGMRLFGFPSPEERSVFLELMKVEGIGPKQALRILSGIRPADLDAALGSEDLAALQRIPGVGPKRATALKVAMDETPGAVAELMSALQWMTATPHQRKLMDMPKIPMWGDKTFENCRRWMFGGQDTNIRGDMKLSLELRYEEDRHDK